MKKIIIFLAILVLTILFTSCTTQQRIVYRECDCNTTTYNFRWNDLVWGYQPHLWGFNSWNFYPYRVIPRYYTPNRVQPQQPSRYQRRQSIGPRPNRNSNSNFDNTYPYRTPTIPRIETRPSQQNTQPSRVQQRITAPTNNQPIRSRVQNR
jgi:hypothetical protein